MRSLCGLIFIGKTGFDHIRQHKEDWYFSEALGIMRMPSEATLLHRFEAMSQDRRVHEALPGCSVRMLKKVDFKPSIITVSGIVGVCIDTDATILDNSDTKKEGVERAYNGISGYAPVCSFLAGGLIIMPSNHGEGRIQQRLRRGTCTPVSTLRGGLNKKTGLHFFWSGMSKKRSIPP